MRVKVLPPFFCLSLFIERFECPSQAARAYILIQNKSNTSDKEAHALSLSTLSVFVERDRLRLSPMSYLGHTPLSWFPSFAIWASFKRSTEGGSYPPTSFRFGHPRGEVGEVERAVVSLSIFEKRRLFLLDTEFMAVEERQPSALCI